MALASVHTQSRLTALTSFTIQSDSSPIPPAVTAAHLPLHCWLPNSLACNLGDHPNPCVARLTLLSLPPCRPFIHRRSGPHHSLSLKGRLTGYSVFGSCILPIVNTASASAASSSPSVSFPTLKINGDHYHLSWVNSNGSNTVERSAIGETSLRRQPKRSQAEHRNTRTEFAHTVGSQFTYRFWASVETTIPLPRATLVARLIQAFKELDTDLSGRRAIATI